MHAQWAVLGVAWKTIIVAVVSARIVKDDGNMHLLLILVRIINGVVKLTVSFNVSNCCQMYYNYIIATNMLSINCRKFHIITDTQYLQNYITTRKLGKYLRKLVIEFFHRKLVTKLWRNSNIHKNPNWHRQREEFASEICRITDVMQIKSKTYVFFCYSSIVTNGFPKQKYINPFLFVLV